MLVGLVLFKSVVRTVGPTFGGGGGGDRLIVIDGAARQILPIVTRDYISKTR